MGRRSWMGKAGKEAVSGSLPDVFPSGKHHEGGGEAGGILQGLGIYAGTGAGFLPHAFHHIYLYVLYGTGPENDDACLCAEEPSGEGAAAGADSVQESKEPGACKGSTGNSRKNRFDRVRAEVPAPSGQIPQRFKAAFPAGGGPEKEDYPECPPEKIGETDEHKT